MDEQAERVTAELTFYDKAGNVLLTVARGSGLQTLLKVPDGAFTLRHVFWAKERPTIFVSTDSEIEP